VEAAIPDGIEIKMTTAYRSYDFQEILYNNYVSQSGAEEADRFSAKPGQSEHQTGLAVDVSSSSVGYELTDAFGDTSEGKWLAQHAHEYGFILRYPDGKEAITGYMYEPWHLRYVGLFVANEIYQKGFTLEEYILENNLGN
jgi:D-alanyl-D-alanine carboxypeptidase